MLSLQTSYSLNDCGCIITIHLVLGCTSDKENLAYGNGYIVAMWKVQTH